MTNYKETIKKSFIWGLVFAITAFWVVYAANITSVQSQTINSWDIMGKGWFQDVNDLVDKYSTFWWNIVSTSDNNDFDINCERRVKMDNSYYYPNKISTDILIWFENFLGSPSGDYTTTSIFGIKKTSKDNFYHYEATARVADGYVTDNNSDNAVQLIEKKCN